MSTDSHATPEDVSEGADEGGRLAFREAAAAALTVVFAVVAVIGVSLVAVLMSLA